MERGQDRKTCCGCMDLRQGSMLAAGYSLTLGILGLIACSVYTKIYLPLAAEQIAQDHPELDHDLVVSAALGTAWVFWVGVALYAIWILFGLLLIGGLVMKKREMLMPWLVYTVILTALHYIGVLHSITSVFTHSGSAAFRSVPSVMIFVMQLVVGLLNVYAMWCVSHLYRNKAEFQEEVSLCPPITTVPGFTYKRMPENV